MRVAPRAALWLLLAALDANAALAMKAPPTAKPATGLHAYLEARLSPDGRWVASVEGDSAASGGAPLVRDLVLRAADGTGKPARIALPCGRVAQCWPSSLAWTPDSGHLSFTLRIPRSHARSLMQVDARGQRLRRLLAFDGTLDSLRYGPAGQLAMLATEGATKELGAVEAGAPVTGDLDAAPPEQRIAVLRDGRLHWASPPELYVYEYDWRPDGSGFVGTAAAGDGDRNWWVAKLYAFDATSTAARVLYTPTTPAQQLAAPRVSPDGQRVAFIAGLMSDFGSTGGDLYTLPLGGGGALNLTPGIAASVTSAHWGCDGRLAGTLLAGGRTQWVDFSQGATAQAPAVRWEAEESLDTDGSGGAGSCRDGTTAVVHASFEHPAEIAVGLVGHWSDLTHRNGRAKAPYEVRSLSWASDQFQVQGWLVLPAGTAADARLPLVTVVHGGPAAAFTPGFLSPRWQAFLQHGYALFMPNPRGSFGQGASFTQANVRDLGHGDLRDILAGVDAVVQAAPIDPARVGITGHSYGGFMTMWAVTQTTRFKAGVAGAGVANWQSYYGQNGIDEWMIPYFGASVYDDPAVYARSSPINYIRQVQTPTFSYVGEADIECPAAQTQEFGHALRALGKASSTVIYPGEGHAIRDPAHLADIERRTLAWFDRYLK